MSITDPTAQTRTVPSEATLKILVIKSRHIGDVLLTAPVIASLKAHAWPHGRVPRITALVKKGTEPMLRYHPDLDACITFPTRGPEESRVGFLYRQWGWFLRLRRQRFGLVINTTEGDRGIVTAWLYGAPRRIGLAEAKAPAWRHWMLTEAITPRPGYVHTVLRNLSLLPEEIRRPLRRVDLGIAPVHRVNMSDRLQRAGYDPERPLAVVHPAARWFFKCWTDRGMAAVIDHLQGRRGVQVALAGSPMAEETAKRDAILSLCETRPMTFYENLELLDEAALIAEADLFIGVDTAPMHMAAALDTPVVALFGPTGVWDWGPWPNGWSGDDTPYGARRGIQRAGAHVVIQDTRPCVPCGQAGCDNSKRSACLEELSTAAVIREIDITLEQLGLHPPAP